MDPSRSIAKSQKTNTRDLKRVTIVVVGVLRELGTLPFLRKRSSSLAVRYPPPRTPTPIYVYVAQTSGPSLKLSSPSPPLTEKKGGGKKHHLAR